MTLLITPNGFPLACSKEEFNTAARNVITAIDSIEPSDEITFDVQLDLLTVFVKAITDVRGFFEPVVSNPGIPLSTTVVAFLTALADDVNRGDTKATYQAASRSITLWSSLFSLEMPSESLVPPSAPTLAVLKPVAILRAPDVISILSKTRSISELVDIMKILFGDHGHV